MLHCGEPLAHSDQDKESGGGSLSYLNNLPSSFCLFGSGIIGGSAVGIRKKMYRVTGHEVGIGILPKVSPLFLAVTHSNNEASFKQTYCVLCWLTASNVSWDLDLPSPQTVLLAECSIVHRAIYILLCWSLILSLSDSTEQTTLNTKTILNIYLIPLLSIMRLSIALVASIVSGVFSLR